MNRKKILSAVSALALIAASVNGSFITAKAEGETTTPAEYTVQGGTTSFASYIIMDQAASTPVESIHYSIEPYGTDTTGNITIKSGSMGATVGNAEFTIASPTYTAAQDAVIESNHVLNGTTIKDNVTVLTGQKYARANVQVDLRNITFNNVGQFDFLIKQTAGTDPAMTYDATPMMMRVFVVYNTTATGATATDKSLVIGGYVMYTASAVTDTTTGQITSYTVNDGGTNKTTNTKASGFVNNYNVKTLEIAKTVTGNQASHDEYFEFDVDIKNALQPGYMYAVNIKNADALTTINGLSTTAHTNRDFIEANATGEATEKFWLHNGQHIIITNLPVGTSYTVNENKAQVVDKEKYTATAVITGDTINGKVAIADTASEILQSGVYSNVTESQDQLTEIWTFIMVTSKTTAKIQTHTYTRTSTDGQYIENTAVTGEKTYTISQTSATTINFKNAEDNTSADYTLSTNPETLSKIVDGTTVVYTAGTGEEQKPKYVEEVIPTTDGKAITLDTSNLMMTDTYITDNTVITYNNAKTGTVPTGIITTTAPYAAVVLAGFCGLLIFAKKRKKQEEE